jgi:cbb3-type cytochrome oxidase subunit 3
MRLSDIMSSMQLGAYAEVALLLFLGAFGAIVVSVFWSRQTAEWERCRNLPLDDQQPSPNPQPAATRSIAKKKDRP